MSGHETLYKKQVVRLEVKTRPEYQQIQGDGCVAGENGNIIDCTGFCGQVWGLAGDSFKIHEGLDQWQPETPAEKVRNQRAVP